MRGKEERSKHRKKGDRITPAYAGKRFLCSDRPRLLRDHPRLCGEKPRCPKLNNESLGSPPPMRGKGLAAFCVRQRLGITPAYAGKRSSCICASFRSEDHPRLCGEKATRQQRKVKKIGSPPPMRGKGTVRGKSIRPWRITPAYAGKSHSHPCANHCI